MEFEKKSPVKSPPKPVTPSPKKVTPKKPSPATPAAAASDSERTPQLKRGGSYRSYLARAGPQALGSKEIPQVRTSLVSDMRHPPLLWPVPTEEHKDFSQVILVHMPFGYWMMPFWVGFRLQSRVFLVHLRCYTGLAFFPL